VVLEEKEKPVGGGDGQQKSSRGRDAKVSHAPRGYCGIRRNVEGEKVEWFEREALLQGEETAERLALGLRS